jgi:excisionase family DNA binding protein
MQKQRKRLLTAREAADYLGISVATLNRMGNEGRLVPFRTPGGHRRYSLAMLDEYLEGSRRRPPEVTSSAEQSRSVGEETLASV